MQKDDIAHLGTLARIKMTDGEIEQFATEIGAVLEYVADVNEIAVDGVEKVVGDRYNVLREDADPHAASANSEALLKALPAREGDYLKVKKILSQD